MKKENAIDKGRYNKFSKGSYKLINIINRTYYLVPEPFDFQAYKKAFKITETIYPFSKPVYTRFQDEVKKIN